MNQMCNFKNQIIGIINNEYIYNILIDIIFLVLQLKKSKTIKKMPIFAITTYQQTFCFYKFSENSYVILINYIFPIILLSLFFQRLQSILNFNELLHALTINSSLYSIKLLQNIYHTKFILLMNNNKILKGHRRTVSCNEADLNSYNNTNKFKQNNKQNQVVSNHQRVKSIFEVKCEIQDPPELTKRSTEVNLILNMIKKSDKKIMQKNVIVEELNLSTESHNSLFQFGKTKMASVLSKTLEEKYQSNQDQSLFLIPQNTLLQRTSLIKKYPATAQKKIITNVNNYVRDQKKVLKVNDFSNSNSVKTKTEPQIKYNKINSPTIVQKPTNNMKYVKLMQIEKDRKQKKYQEQIKKRALPLKK